MFYRISEYEKYAKALAGSGMNIIAWDFEGRRMRSPLSVSAPAGSRPSSSASRCAPGRRSRKVWDYAWLIDDNVVALEYSPGWKVSRAARGKVCAALGANAPYTFAVMKAAPTALAPSKLLVSLSRGVLQQVGLWNIKLLADRS